MLTVKAPTLLLSSHSLCSPVAIEIAVCIDCFVPIPMNFRSGVFLP